MPQSGKSVFTDQLRGDIEFDFTQMDDQILLKSDGYPTYHLANVVDDHLMGVTHVIRAEEWISSTPKHVTLYKAFGWDLPQFIHMPLLRNLDRSKLSKRKNPTSLLYYRRKGILPAAMLNFLALMGWAYSETQEVFTLEEMISKFDFNQVHLGGPVFDPDKLLWMNGQYIRKLTPQDFSSYVRKEVFSEKYLEKLHPLIVERLEAFEQFTEKFSFFFCGAVPFANESSRTTIEIKSMLSDLVDKLDEIPNWELPLIENALKEQLKILGWKPKDFFMTIRLAVTGRPDSPPLVETMVVLGKEIVRFRLKDAASRLN